MRARIHIFLATMILTLCLAGNALAEGFAIKLSTLSPDGTALVKALREASDQIKEKTEGRVYLKIYTGGVMGSDEQVIRKMRMGQLHGGFLSAGPLSKLEPNFAIMTMPMLIRSNAEADAARAFAEPVIIEKLGKEGFLSMGMLELGFVYLMSNLPLTSQEQITQSRPWNPEGNEIGKEIFEAFGVTPVSLAVPDVLTGLQTGLIDTIFSSPVAALALQWFTKVKYLTETPLLYSYGSLILFEKGLKKVSKEDLAVVTDILRKATKDLDELSRRDADKAMDTLRKQGIEFLPVDEASLARFQEIADTLIDKRRAEGKLDAALLDKLRATVKQVRGQ